jgi:hypothetical protein
MARSVARLKMGYYPLPESEGTKLRGLLAFNGPASWLMQIRSGGLRSAAIRLILGAARLLGRLRSRARRVKSRQRPRPQ